MLLTIATIIAFCAAVAHAQEGDGNVTCTNVPLDKISIQLWSVRDQMDADAVGTLTFIRDAGFVNVEPYSFNGYTGEEFNQILTDLGLSAPSMHVGMGQLTGDVDQLIADAQAIGTKDIILGWAPPEYRTLEGVTEMASIFNEVGYIVRLNGMQLAYHNHDFDFYTLYEETGQTMYETFTSLTNAQTTKLQIDTYWVVEGGEDPVDIINTYSNRIQYLHVKDRKAADVPVDDTFLFEDIGEGTIDFEAVFATKPFKVYAAENDDTTLGDWQASVTTMFDNLSTAQACFPARGPNTLASSRSRRGPRGSLRGGRR